MIRRIAPGELDPADPWPDRSGMPLVLRILAGIGALSFLLLGINSLLPALQPPVRPLLPSTQNRAAFSDAGAPVLPI
jgi:hypothetical protein